MRQPADAAEQEAQLHLPLPIPSAAGHNRQGTVVLGGAEHEFDRAVVLHPGVAVEPQDRLESWEQPIQPKLAEICRQRRALGQRPLGESGIVGDSDNKRARIPQIRHLFGRQPGIDHAERQGPPGCGRKQRLPQLLDEGKIHRVAAGHGNRIMPIHIE